MILTLSVSDFDPISIRFGFDTKTLSTKKSLTHAHSVLNENFLDSRNSQHPQNEDILTKETSR